MIYLKLKSLEKSFQKKFAGEMLKFAPVFKSVEFSLLFFHSPELWQDMHCRAGFSPAKHPMRHGVKPKELMRFARRCHPSVHGFFFRQTKPSTASRSIGSRSLY
jgi:hypothetical protein